MKIPDARASSLARRVIRRAKSSKLRARLEIRWITQPAKELFYARICTHVHVGVEATRGRDMIEVEGM